VPLALAVVLFAPATLGSKVISAGRVVPQQPPYSPPTEPLAPAEVLQSDSGFVFEPDGLLVRRAPRAGRLPIWTTAMSAGLGPSGVVVPTPARCRPRSSPTAGAPVRAAPRRRS
jgi:hypothetical protein